MKLLKTTACYCIFLLTLLGCKKDDDSQRNAENKNVEVKASVINEERYEGLRQQYWKVGVLFDKTVTATGTATVSWYFNAGWINGNPTNRYTKTVSFTINGNSNAYYEFTDWKVDYTMKADSVKISNFNLTSGDYKVTIKQ